MTYYGGKEMAASLRTVRANTIKIAKTFRRAVRVQAGPESARLRSCSCTSRSGPRYQLHIHRNEHRRSDDGELPGADADGRRRGSEAAHEGEIIALLRSRGEKFASFLEGLTDEFLAEPVAMPPGAQPATKSRFEMLLSPKEHEMHHRGQLMVMQRMIGTGAAPTRADAGAHGAARGAQAPGSRAGR